MVGNIYQSHKSDFPRATDPNCTEGISYWHMVPTVNHESADVRKGSNSEGLSKSHLLAKLLSSHNLSQRCTQNYRGD